MLRRSEAQYDRIRRADRFPHVGVTAESASSDVYRLQYRL